MLGKLVASGIQPIILLLIDYVDSLVDPVIDGSQLNLLQRKLVLIAYFGAMLFLPEIVADTKNTYDDRALVEFGQVCKDLAKEGGYELIEPPGSDTIAGE